MRWKKTENTLSQSFEGFCPRSRSFHGGRRPAAQLLGPLTICLWLQGTQTSFKYEIHVLRLGYFLDLLMISSSLFSVLSPNYSIKRQTSSICLMFPFMFCHFILFHFFNLPLGIYLQLLPLALLWNFTV